MILREWRGRRPRDKVDACRDVLERTGLKDDNAAGHRGKPACLRHCELRSPEPPDMPLLRVRY
ncbi:MAG TPA: hypothetical protein VF267_07090 [Gammaproteobacteria bacterium]